MIIIIKYDLIDLEALMQTLRGVLEEVDTVKSRIESLLVDMNSDIEFLSLPESIGVIDSLMESRIKLRDVRDVTYKLINNIQLASDLYADVEKDIIISLNSLTKSISTISEKMNYYING